MKNCGNMYLAIAKQLSVLRSLSNFHPYDTNKLVGVMHGCCMVTLDMLGYSSWLVLRNPLFLDPMVCLVVST